MKPLDGIKILDLTRILAGPYCTMTLSDFGADVIKVERPGSGDDTRKFGPPFVSGESAYFMSINRNKKSITLNIKSKAGIDILRDLIKQSDILVENFRPGALNKIGLDYESVHKLNSKLIYASISGFGHTGPYAVKPGYDLAIQGLGGLMSITGQKNGPPTKVGTSIADILSGIYAVQGILLALYARERTGKGQKVDISMLDGQVSLLTYQAGIFFTTGKSPERIGNQHPTICPYETFSSKDGYFNLAVGNDKLWQKLAELLEITDSIKDKGWDTNPSRVQKRDDIFGFLSDIFKTEPTAHWLKVLETAGIPAGPILNIGETLTHPQTEARGMVAEVTHPHTGNIKLTGVPVKLSDTPGGISAPPPLLGEHTAEVLKKYLDKSEQEIEELKSKGVI